MASNPETGYSSPEMPHERKEGDETETATVERIAQTDSPWYTKGEACAYLRISMDTLDRWISDGTVAVHKVRGRQSVRIHRDDMDAALKRVG